MLKAGAIVEMMFVDEAAAELFSALLVGCELVVVAAATWLVAAADVTVIIVVIGIEGAAELMICIIPYAMAGHMQEQGQLSGSALATGVSVTAAGLSETAAAV